MRGAAAAGPGRGSQLRWLWRTQRHAARTALTRVRQTTFCRRGSESKAAPSWESKALSSSSSSSPAPRPRAQAGTSLAVSPIERPLDPLERFVGQLPAGVAIAVVGAVRTFLGGDQGER